MRAERTCQTGVPLVVVAVAPRVAAELAGDRCRAVVRRCGPVAVEGAAPRAIPIPSIHAGLGRSADPSSGVRGGFVAPGGVEDIVGRPLPNTKALGQVFVHGRSQSHRRRQRCGHVAFKLEIAHLPADGPGLYVRAEVGRQLNISGEGPYIRRTRQPAHVVHAARVALIGRRAGQPSQIGGSERIPAAREHPEVIAEGGRHVIRLRPDIRHVEPVAERQIVGSRRGTRQGRGHGLCHSTFRCEG